MSSRQVSTSMSSMAGQDAPPRALRTAVHSSWSKIFALLWEAHAQRATTRRRSSREGSAVAEPGVEAAAGQPLVGLDVLGARLLDDLVRELRPGRAVVPAAGVEPVADELLVVRRLGPARLPPVGGPEAGGVRG